MDLLSAARCVHLRMRYPKRRPQCRKQCTDAAPLRRPPPPPPPAGVAAVILDEFHERSLDADLSLAFCQQAQTLLRPELRIVVMSATLGEGLAKGCSDLLGGAPVVVSEGRSFPVEMKYVGEPGRNRGDLEVRLVFPTGLRVGMASVVSSLCLSSE